MTMDNKDNGMLAKKIAAVLISIALTGFITVWAKTLLMPLVFAALFSLGLLPLAGLMERKWRFHRVLASALSVMLVLAIGSAVIYAAFTELGRFSAHIPEFKQKLGSISAGIKDWVAGSFHITPDKQEKYMDQSLARVSAAGTAVVGLTLYTLGALVLFITLTAFFIFFMLMYRDRLAAFLWLVLSKENNTIVKDILGGVRQMIKGYITGILLEMTIVSTLCAVAFSLLGIPYPLLLGLMTGMFNIIPYAGIFSSMAISMLVTLVAGGTGTKILLVAAVVVPVHLLDSNIILPFLVGSRVRVNAFISFLAIVTGGLLWGIAGIFLSIPLTAVAKIIFDRVEALGHLGFLFGDDEKAVKKILRFPQKKQKSPGQV
jgi:putative permease